MTMSTAEKATQRQNSASQRKVSRKDRETGRNDERGSEKTAVIPLDAIPLEKVLYMFQHANVTGLMSRESLRRAFHTKKLPGFIKGKNRIFFERQPVLDMVGNMSVGSGLTIDQALICHFEASEFNTPISAVAAGITNLAKARQVWRDWRETQKDPGVPERIEAKARAEASQVAKDEQPIEMTCSTCYRTPERASSDDEAITLAVAGHKGSLSASELRALAGFQDHKCTGCWRWLPNAPTASMRELLAPQKT